MTDLRTAAQQALEILERLHGGCTDSDDGTVEAITVWVPEIIDDLRAALAEPVLQTCNCRWDGEVQVQQCTLHEAHVDAIHEWAGRAKFAEKKLAALAEQRLTDMEQKMERSIESLKAALVEPVQEPVAWRFEARHIDSAWAAAVTMKHPGPEGKYMRKVTPLYAAPPQRKPLTEEEISNIWDGHIVPIFGKNGINPVVFARAIERAHGVTP